MKDPWDVETGPRPVTRVKRERTVERAGDLLAERRGYEALKVRVMGQDGFPDKWYVRKGHTLIWEWKKLGEVPEGLQPLRLEWLAEVGYDVGWSDNVAEFERRLK